MHLISPITIFIAFIVLLGGVGILYSFNNVRNSFRAQKKLIDLLSKDPEKSKEIQNAYEEIIQKHQYDKFNEIELVLKEEASRLNNLSEQKSIIDALDNNTEEGKRRY